MSGPFSPAQMQLEVFTSFKASHSLAGFETPHFHLWKLALGFTAPFPLADDRVLDLVFLQKTLDEVIASLAGTYLNQSLGMSPTSENVCVWINDKISKKLPTAPLTFVRVTLCDLAGEAMGCATLRGRD